MILLQEHHIIRELKDLQNTTSTEPPLPIEVLRRSWKCRANNRYNRNLAIWQFH